MLGTGVGVGTTGDAVGAVVGDGVDAGVAAGAPGATEKMAAPLFQEYSVAQSFVNTPAFTAQVPAGAAAGTVHVNANVLDWPAANV